jgi:transcriptional regulator with XRE-family HTH domain
MRGRARTDHDLGLIALGMAIRHHRHVKGLTIEALAHKAGMSAGHLSWIERGHGNPRWDTLCAVASALDMPLAELCDEAPSMDTMLALHGERRLTPEEFEEHFGQLPTDGEG